ncbi:hypothetical protein LZK75_28410 (plasmid) [Rhizobium leguminosarum]|nr:hypothetical protein LZK75_28410 [Rhizobium leguminosarum]
MSFPIMVDFRGSHYPTDLILGVVEWITRRLILSVGFQSQVFQSPDQDFDDAAQVQCRSAGQDCQAEISGDELAGI